MLPDKTLDECIELVGWWFDDAIRRRDETGDFNTQFRLIDITKF